MRLAILLILITGTNAVASQADGRRMADQLLALQQRDRPLLVDPEFNYPRRARNGITTGK